MARELRGKGAAFAHASLLVLRVVASVERQDGGVAFQPTLRCAVIERPRNANSGVHGRAELVLMGAKKESERD